MATALTIREHIHQLGADVCGIAAVARFEAAPRGFHPCDLFDHCQSVIVFGKALPQGTLEVSPRLLYLKAMGECLAELDRMSFLASRWIEDCGGGAVPLPSDAPHEFWDAERQTARGLLSLKHAAVEAGLGEIGKSTLLLNPTWGNRLMLGCVLTDLELPSDPVAPASLCPTHCRICLNSCPMRALDGVTIDQSRCRQLVYGFNAKGYAICNCNICRRTCPNARRR
jgi:epoxyqueuosine reductase